MWELIRANRRKSVLLFISMGTVLILLGFVIGAYIGGPEIGFNGIIIATLVWLVMSLIGMYSGSSILLASSNAVQVDRKVHPQLFNVVEEMSLAAGMKTMPNVYIIQSNALNAFATGRDPEHSAIAVTAGLLAVTTRDELQGVVAHEMSHIVNRDIRFMTFAGIMLGSIVLISQVFLRGMFYSSMGRYRGSSKDNGAGQLIIMAVAVLFAILAPIAAQLLYFAVSRKREYLADASGVRLTRYPEGLASALEKIGGSSADLESANKVTAPMFIANPLKEKGQRMRNLSSTHPPIEERIRILRALSGASYMNYQETYQQVTGRKSSLIPNSGLAETESMAFRRPGEAAIASPAGLPFETLAGKPDKVAFRRSTGNLIMAANGFRFLDCGCGMKFKIPPGYKNKELKCSKCGTVHPL